MLRAALLAAFMTCSACGPPATAVAPLDVASSAPQARPTPPPPPADAPACKVAATELFGWQTIEVSAAPGRAPFAKVWGAARAEVTLPVAAHAASLGGVVEADGMVLRAWVPKDKVGIYPARPFVLRGFYAVAPWALGWTGAVAGGVELAIPMPPNVHLVPPDSAVREVRPCGDLTLKPPSFDPYESFHGDLEPRLLHGTGIPFALTPDGPPVATVDGGDDSVVVLLVESRGASTRIAWPPFEPEPRASALFGWVPTSALKAAPQGASIGHNEYGSFGRSGHGSGDFVGYVNCARPVPLKVREGQDVLEVGTVNAGKTIDRMRDGTARPRSENGNIELLNGATWVVDAAAIEGCASTSRTLKPTP